MEDKKKTKGELICELEELRTFFLIVDQSPASTILLDKDLIVQYVNPACVEATGYSVDEFIGKHIDILRSDLHAPEYYKTIWPTVRSGKVWRGDVCSRRKNGEIIWELISISPLRLSTGEITHFLSVMVDDTERKKAEEKILHMAFHDSLTGLANRALLIDHLEQTIALAKRNKKFAAVLFLDLDRFKLINDTLGHTRGDEVLKAVGKRLKEHTRKSDTLARQGGDEFTIIAQGLKRIEDIPKVTDNFFSVFKEPFNIEGNDYSFTISMGISIYPNDGEDADTLIKNADIAMYEAKDEGRNNYKLFNKSMHESIIRRLELENKLLKALEEDEFLLHYQPQVDINNGELVGLEALVRWDSPGHGLVPLGDFIPLAEETGFIVSIGEWVLYKACAQNKLWQDQGLKPVTVAVNISMRHFSNKDFVSTVDRILKETGLDPKYLELELTESIASHDIETTLKTLGEFKALGIRLSIDDFGTGYSSLEYLKLMPMNMLKIAQCFIKGLSYDSSDIAIARATIQLAKSLDFEVIAEGVETREQLTLLGDLQCEKIQGHLFSKALPGSEIEEFLAKEWSFDIDREDNK